MMFMAGCKPWCDLTDADLAGYRAYSNLSNYCDIALERPCLPITLLRHPLYRAASLYRLAKRLSSHHYHALAVESDLETFYKIASNRSPTYFQNLQTNRICGHPDAELALEYIRSRYLLVGFTDRHGDFVRELSKIFNWSSINIVSKPPDCERYRDSIGPRLRDLILSQNEEDLILFETMSKGYPAVPRRRTLAQKLVRQTIRSRKAVMHAASSLPRYLLRFSGKG